METKNLKHLMRHYSLVTDATLHGFTHVTLSTGKHSLETTVFFYSLELKKNPQDLVWRYAIDGDGVKFETLDVDGREVYTYTLRTQY